MKVAFETHKNLYNYKRMMNLPLTKIRGYDNNLSFQGLGQKILAEQNRLFNVSNLNVENILHFSIPNLNQASKNGFRGETLSGKNSKFLKPLQRNGITTIIDLRYKDLSDKYEGKCLDAGLNYFHFPIDAKVVDFKEIIKKLPEFFKILGKDNYYIACAMGLHRTDIALAVNYMFNPIEQKVPKMIGHLRNNEFKNEKISEFINKIKKNITEEDLRKLGWKTDFEEVFKLRRDNLLAQNRQWAKEN